MSLSGVDESERVPAASVTPGLFQLLGVDAAIGRTFLFLFNEHGDCLGATLRPGRDTSTGGCSGTCCAESGRCRFPRADGNGLTEDSRRSNRFQARRGLS